jgi:endonuclease YncB( thermonuclease family)
MTRLAALALLWAVAWWCPRPSMAAEFTSYAIVREDASMVIQGRVVRLYGIYIPDTGRTCRTFFSPPECGTRAALALEFKTGTHFVTCREVAALSDGSVSAVCWADEEDLAAYLIRQGWALAGPDAPFEYVALERIAERRGLGVWGFPVGEFRFRRHRHW